MNTNIQPLPEESLEQFLWRIGNERELLGLMWSEVADIINRAYQPEDNYLSESVYRKKYAAAKLFYDEVFNKGEFKSDDNQEQLRKIERAKTQLRDERTAYNAQNRDAARLDENFRYLGEQLKYIGRKEFEVDSANVIDIRKNSPTEMICCLSDLHIGSEYYSNFGQYDSCIAFKRLEEFLNRVIEIGRRHRASVIHVALLGDLVSGIIRPSVQLSNRENLVVIFIQIKFLIWKVSTYNFHL